MRFLVDAAGRWYFTRIGDLTATGSFFATLREDVHVPEPGTFVLIGAALAGLGLSRRRLAS